MSKNEILKKLEEGLQGAKDLKLAEEKKENPYATSQAWGYLKSAVEGILKQEGIKLCIK